MRPLTAKQEDVLRFIAKRIQENYPPTLREIAAFLLAKSTNAAQDHLFALEKKVYLARDLKGASRAMTLTRKAQEHLGLAARLTDLTPPTVPEGMVALPLLRFWMISDGTRTVDVERFVRMSLAHVGMAAFAMRTRSVLTDRDDREVLFFRELTEEERADQKALLGLLGKTMLIDRSGETETTAPYLVTLSAVEMHAEHLLFRFRRGASVFQTKAPRIMGVATAMVREVGEEAADVQA